MEALAWIGLGIATVWIWIRAVDDLVNPPHDPRYKKDGWRL